MTLFDVIALLILAVSALIGFVRGGLREVITVFAFVLALLVAIFSLRLTGPLFRSAINPDWAGTTAAILVVFVAAYIVIRVMGSGASRRMQSMQTLGAVDQVAGVAFGLVRGLIVLGVFNLAFNAATPAVRVPRWISDAALYPLSATCAKALRKLAPEGSAVAGRLGPHLKDAIDEGSGAQAEPSADPSKETPG